MFYLKQIMTDSKHKNNQSAPQPQAENQPQDMAQDVEAAEKKADAQVNLMGNASVDPLPLVDEEKDPIAQKAKQVSDSES